MLLWVFDNWVLMALFAAGAWAMSSVIDVCFVSNGIYKSASDGTTVSGLFCIIPAIASWHAVDLAGIEPLVVCIGVLSGIAYLLHVYFYFKALFELNDAVNAEVFNSLSVLVVPVLAFLFLGERLAWSNYLAIAITALAVVVLIGFQATRLSLSAIVHLATSVLCISIMMVAQAWVLNHADYLTAVWLYSSAAFVLSVTVCGARRKNRQRVSTMFRQFGAFFVTVELLEIAAVLGSQRATDKGPSVSLVALVECTLPIFVMVFSLAIALSSKRLLPTRSVAIRKALSLQTIAAPSKVASMVLIACAIFIVQK